MERIAVEGKLYNQMQRANVPHSVTRDMIKGIIAKLMQTAHNIEFEAKVRFYLTAFLFTIIYLF